MTSDVTKICTVKIRFVLGRHFLKRQQRKTAEPLDLSLIFFRDQEKFVTE